MNNCRRGHFAEYVALWFLRLKGYRLLHRNYLGGRGTRAGEVDLIMRRGRQLVFVEVKQRADLAAAAFSLLPAQQQRIRRAAEAFLSRCPQYRDYTIRFDAVLVKLPCRVVHLTDAF